MVVPMDIIVNLLISLKTNKPMTHNKEQGSKLPDAGKQITWEDIEKEFADLVPYKIGGNLHQRDFNEGAAVARTFFQSKFTPLLSELSQARELHTAYEDYIKILVDEINDLVGIASIHGWKSRNVERRNQAREEIRRVTKSKRRN